MNAMIKLEPAFKDYLWGGTKLRTVYGKNCDFDKVAESWELSDHKDGQSIVASGKMQGKTFHEYLAEIGREGLGTHCDAFENFPVLIKFIDAKQSLSIQVHPSDEYALEHEGQYGKTEMWYILDCEPGAYLYYGVNQEVSAEEFRKRIEDNTVLEVLNKVEVHKGDVYFIPSGTIHAIGAGIVICEIQQNSNCTYRVYDFDRRDANGNARELHVDKAIAVSDFEPAKQKPGAFGEEEQLEGYTAQLLGKCKYFTTTKYVVESSMEIPIDVTSFTSFIVVEGNVTMTLNGQTLEAGKGDSIFVPAQEGTISVNGNAQLIMTRI
ncbi:MAG: type I phosphomannose isomerase catalytic subunit [Lachnospiraceae bacterium]